VSQVLSAVGLQLDAMRMDFRAEAPGIEERAAEIQNMLEQVIEQLRDISNELNPSVVERGRIAIRAGPFGRQGSQEFFRSATIALRFYRPRAHHHRKDFLQDRRVRRGQCIGSPEMHQDRDSSEAGARGNACWKCTIMDILTRPILSRFRWGKC